MTPAPAFYLPLHTANLRRYSAEDRLRGACTYYQVFGDFPAWMRHDAEVMALARERFAPFMAAAGELVRHTIVSP